MRAHVIDRRREPIADEVGPGAVHHRAGDERVVARRHQAGQFAAAIGFGARIDFGVDENRIGDLHLAAALSKNTGPEKLPETSSA